MYSQHLINQADAERRVTLLYQEYNGPLVNTVQIQSLHSVSDLFLSKSKFPGARGGSLSSWSASSTYQISAQPGLQSERGGEQSRSYQDILTV